MDVCKSEAGAIDVNMETRALIKNSFSDYSGLKKQIRWRTTGDNTQRKQRQHSKKEKMRSLIRKYKGKTRLRQMYYFVNPVKMRSLPSVRCYLHHLQTSLAPGLRQKSCCALLILRLIKGRGKREALGRTLLFSQERAINEFRKWAVKSLHEGLGMISTCAVH